MPKRKNSDKTRGLSVLTTNATVEDTEEVDACALRASRMMEEEAIIYSIKGLFRLASNRGLSIHPLHVECFKRISKLFNQLISSLDSVKWSVGTRDAVKNASCCRVVKVNYDKPNADLDGSIRCVACGAIESNEQYAIDFGGPYEPPFVLSDPFAAGDLDQFSSIPSRFDKFIKKYTRTMDEMEGRNCNDKGRYHVGCYCMHHMTLSWSLRRHFDTIYYNISVELDSKPNESALKDAWYLTRLAATTKSTIDLIEHARNVISSRSYIQKSAFPIDIDKTYWSRFQTMRQSTIKQLQRKHDITLSIPEYSHALALVYNVPVDGQLQPHIKQLQETIDPQVLQRLQTSVQYAHSDDEGDSSHSESEEESESDESNDAGEYDNERDGENESEEESEDDLSDFIDDDIPHRQTQQKPIKRRRRILAESDDDEQEEEKGDQPDDNDTAIREPTDADPTLTDAQETVAPPHPPIPQRVSISLENYNLLATFLTSNFASPWSSQYASIFYEVVSQQSFSPERRTHYSTWLDRLMNELATHVDGDTGPPMATTTRRVIVSMKKEMVNKLQSQDVPDCFQEASCVDKLVYTVGETFQVDLKPVSINVVTSLTECMDTFRHTILMLVQCDWALHFERVVNDTYRSSFATLIMNLLEVCDDSWTDPTNTTLDRVTTSLLEFYNERTDPEDDTHKRIHTVVSDVKVHIHNALTFMYGLRHATLRL